LPRCQILLCIRLSNGIDRVCKIKENKKEKKYWVWTVDFGRFRRQIYYYEAITSHHTVVVVVVDVLSIGFILPTTTSFVFPAPFVFDKCFIKHNFM